MIRPPFGDAFRDLPPLPAEAAASPVPADLAVSLLIPARGAADTLAATVRTAHDFLDARFRDDFEIILIPNPAPGDAQDGSIHAAAELSRALPAVRSVIHARPPGKGAALRTGFARARGRQIWFTDADLPYDLEFFDRAHPEVERGYALVAGNRRLPTSVFDLPVALLKIAHQRHRLGLLFNRLARVLLPLTTTDTQAGIKAMSRELAARAFERQRCPGFFFDLEFYLAAGGAGYANLSLPVTLRLNSEKSTVRVLRESLLAGYWMLRIAFLERRGHYRRDARPPAPPALFRSLAASTRAFLWLRWWLTPYSDMAREFAPRARVLDLGCGHGLFAFLLARAAGRRVTALDHDPDRVRLAREAAARGGFPHLAFDAVNLTAGVPAGDPVDGIALIDVLHYFPPEQQRRIVQTARARLAPGGKLLFREVDPRAGLVARLNRAYERVATGIGFTRSEKKTELHFRARADWESLLRECGFEASSRPCSSPIFADVLFVGSKASAPAAPSGGPA